MIINDILDKEWNKGDNKMSKTQKVWQSITTILLVIVGVLFTLILIKGFTDMEVEKQQKAQQEQIETLQQEVQTIKQSLDDKGFEDLNL